jgi:hypothetical protein
MHLAWIAEDEAQREAYQAQYKSQEWRDLPRASWLAVLPGVNTCPPTLPT